jgi:hypothetical protein
LVGPGTTATNPEEPTPRAIYWRFLGDEGYPTGTLTPIEIEGLGPTHLRAGYSAVILPENVALPPGTVEVLASYVRDHGGKLVCAWTAGDGGGGDAAGLWGLLGLTPLDSEAPGGVAPPTLWTFPPGSPVTALIDPGILDGPYFRPVGLIPMPSPRRAVAPKGAVLVAPDVWLHRFPGGGLTVFINGHPAEEKRVGDDALFRVLLKYFLDELAGTPRIVMSPGGVGGLVINLHVCSSAYLGALDRLFRREVFPPDLRLSVHVTPGPDDLRPGDGLGVYADSPAKGRPFVQELARHGEVGAHGGWMHDGWAGSSAGWLAPVRRRYLDQSLDSLAAVVGRPVLEYSAPGGVHDRDTDDHLARRGVLAAAYPGGEDAPPAHAWVEGKGLSRLWHFGYSGDQYGLCPESMLAAGRSPEEVAEEVRALVARAAQRREIRLFYLHPASLADRPIIWRALISEVRTQLAAGRLTVAPMSAYARFLNQAERIELAVWKAGPTVIVEMAGPASLRGVAVALPVSPEYAVARSSGTGRLTFDNGGSVGYLAVETDTNHFSAILAPSP